MQQLSGLPGNESDAPRGQRGWERIRILLVAGVVHYLRIGFCESGLYIAGHSLERSRGIQTRSEIRVSGCRTTPPAWDPSEWSARIKVGDLESLQPALLIRYVVEEECNRVVAPKLLPVRSRLAFPNHPVAPLAGQMTRVTSGKCG